MKLPIPVMTVLAQTLALHVELNLGDVDEDIEEMADLCDELLNSDISIRFVTKPIADFVRAITVYFTDRMEWKIRSEKVTACLRRAIVCLPGLDPVTIALARSLLSRFVVAHSDDD